MTKFLKLNNMLLNTNNIQKILIQPNKYYIHITDLKFSGSSLSISPFGFGRISSFHERIEVCENKNPNQYKIVSEWMNKN